jgi:hypothetical protein
MKTEDIVWCLHCERVGLAVETFEGGEDEVSRACSYSGCDAAEYDLWSWAAPYERGKVYEMYSDEFMKAMGAPST